MVSQTGFLLFHASAEVFATIISFGVFFICWNTRRIARASFFLIVGPAFAVVGTADLLHTLTYKGMGTYAGGDANLPTQLWVAARATEVVAVLAGVLLAGRPMRHTLTPLLAAWTGGLLLAASLAAGVFPDCYVADTGLTPFKIAVEYLFVALKLATAAVLWRQHRHFDRHAARWLVAYLAVSAVSELAFTSYIGVYDGMNQLGHVLKVAGFFAIYQATVKAVLQRPYTVLFHDLQAAREKLETTVEERTRALAETNGMLQTIIDCAPIAIFANDTDGTVILWNDAAERLYGWSADEVLGRPLRTAPPDKIEEQRRMIRRVLDGELLVGSELHRLRRDGTPVVVLDYAAPLRAADGSIRGLVSLVLDVTAERAAERAVRQGEERMRALMATVPDAILTVSQDGVIESCNAAAERLFGYVPAELVGGNVELLLPRDALSGLAARELTARRKDGRTVPVELAANEMSLEDRRLFVVVLRDITERLRERQQRAAMERELMHAQKMEALGSLAGGIAHEVNNMLTPILGLSEVALLRLPPDSPVRGNLEKVVEAANRARDILRKVLAFSRADISPPVPLPLVDLVRESLPLVRAALPLEARLACSLPDEPLVARCSRTEFQQVLMNLCSNAGQALQGREGQVEIALAVREVDAETAATLGLRPGAHAELSVRDDGVGMDEEVVDKIFEPFFTTKPVGEGTGMGLSVVHAIILGWDGAVAVDSSPGCGATFRVHLPLDRETVAVPA